MSRPLGLVERFWRAQRTELQQRSLRWQAEECRQSLRELALDGGAVVQAVVRELGDRRDLMTDTMNMITPIAA